MGMCVGYQGSIPPQYKEEFISLLNHTPETFYDTGEWVTDGWNHRGWEPLLTAIKTIAENHNCITTMNCYYDDGPEMYCTSYTCDGDTVTETEVMETREEDEDW